MEISLLVAAVLASQTPDLVLEGELATDGPPYVPISFEVPAGTVELEVVHDDLSEENVLDWGLLDPEGRFRGWGGGNAEPAVIGEQAASRSYLRGDLAPGAWSLLVGKALVAAPPAAYRVELTFRAEATLPAAEGRAAYDPTRAVVDERRWYAGDFHVHSEQSGDAVATLDEIAALAQERGLDFVVVTEHNTTSHFDRLAPAMDRHEGLLLIPGIEVTTYAGHAGAFGTSEWLDFRLQEGRSAADLLDDATAQRALLSINHPVLDFGDSCLGCKWEHEADLFGLAGVEIQTGGSRLFFNDAVTFWEERLDRGERPAALGGSDDHRAGVDLGLGQSPIGSPTTMVLADELSADAVLAGVKAGRTVVKLTGPEGPMIELRPAASDDGEVVVQGSGPSVSALLTGAEGLDLYWVVDGALDSVVTVDAAPFEAGLDLSGRPERLRAELWEGSQPVAITSHLFFAYATPPDDEDPPVCACGAAKGKASPTGWPLLLGFGLFSAWSLIGPRSRSRRPPCTRS